MRLASVLSRLGACVAAAMVCAGIAACGSAVQQPSGATTSIWDVRAARFIDEARLVAELRAARFRLLGEVHDNPAHHAIRAHIVERLAAGGARPAVVMEQFDLEHDDALVAAQRPGADAQALAEAGQLNLKGWAWPLHRPLIDAALAHGLPVRAANLSRAWLRASTAAADAPWHRRLEAAPWGEEKDKRLRAELIDGHCGRLPMADLPRILQAQRQRDAAMAQALADAATPDGAILIAGNGHVRADLGVPLYLRESPPGTRSVSVGFVEFESEEADGAAAARKAAADHPGFDFLWLTAPVARPVDPCAAS